jgi:hypothetical protein
MAMGTVPLVQKSRRSKNHDNRFRQVPETWPLLARTGGPELSPFSIRRAYRAMAGPYHNDGWGNSTVVLSEARRLGMMLDLRFSLVFLRT